MPLCLALCSMHYSLSRFTLVGYFKDGSCDLKTAFSTKELLVLLQNSLIFDVSVPLANVTTAASSSGNGGTAAATICDFSRTATSARSGASRKGSVESPTTNLSLITPQASASSHRGHGGPIHVIGHQDTPAVALDYKTSFVA